MLKSPTRIQFIEHKDGKVNNEDKESLNDHLQRVVVKCTYFSNEVNNERYEL